VCQKLAFQLASVFLVCRDHNIMIYSNGNTTKFQLKQDTADDVLHTCTDYISRITYKLCTLMHAVVYGQRPQYLMDMVVSVLPAGLIYVQLKRGFRYTAHSLTLPTDRDPFLSQLHRRGITCWLTFDGSAPSPPSRDISRPICFWLHIPVRLPRPSFNHYFSTALLGFIL